MHENEDTINEGFTHEEITIINSIIDLRNLEVKKIMIPSNKVF